MAPEDVLDRLTSILPGFAQQWASTQNCFREDDGSFTFCGVFAECSHFVREHYESLTDQQRTALAQFIGECMAAEQTDLDTAAATCFLENLVAERFSEDLATYLTGPALEYFRNWGLPGS